MTAMEHYLSTRISTMAAMLEVAAKRLRKAGDAWAAGECEREAKHGREAIEAAGGPPCRDILDDLTFDSGPEDSGLSIFDDLGTAQDESAVRL